MDFNSFSNSFLIVGDVWNYDFYFKILEGSTKTNQVFFEEFMESNPDIENIRFRIVGNIAYFVVPTDSILTEDYATQVTEGVPTEQPVVIDEEETPTE